MPLDSVPDHRERRRPCRPSAQAADGQCHVDVGFWGGVIPGNLGELAPLHEAGRARLQVLPRGLGTDDFPPLDAGGDDGGAARSARISDARCSSTPKSAEAAAALGDGSGRHYADYLASRPRGLENLAVARGHRGGQATGGHAHIVHLSSSDALPMIASARREGVRVTAETCPHYLTLTAEEIADGATAFKCSPPIREAANRELLWAGLRDGVLDLVVSDHSPCTPAMKELGDGDFGTAWGGISSLQLGLPVVWTEARRRGFSLAHVASLDGEPARRGSPAWPRKGRIAAGYRRGPLRLRARTRRSPSTRPACTTATR